MQGRSFLKMLEGGRAKARVSKTKRNSKKSLPAPRFCCPGASVTSSLFHLAYLVNAPWMGVGGGMSVCTCVLGDHGQVSDSKFYGP